MSSVEVTTVSFSFVGDRAAVVAELINSFVAGACLQQECTLLAGETSVNIIDLRYVKGES
jgi:hypothetical protein